MARLTREEESELATNKKLDGSKRSEKYVQQRESLFKVSMEGAELLPSFIIADVAHIIIRLGSVHTRK